MPSRTGAHHRLAAGVAGGGALPHLRAHADGVERACFPDHLTAGILVVDRAGEHVLLNLHRKARRWFHFGGHLEPADTTLLGAARREGLEESGLADLAVDPVPAQLSEHTVDFCDPRGQFIGAVGSPYDEELIVRDLNLDLVTEVRQLWQFYRDRRPDAYGDLVAP